MVKILAKMISRDLEHLYKVHASMPEEGYSQMEARKIYAFHA